MVMRTSLDITLYLHCVSCLCLSYFGFIIIIIIIIIINRNWDVTRWQ